MSRNTENKISLKRYLMLLIGIYLMGTGIALIIKSSTGTSPMSSLTNVMTQVFPVLTLGTYTFLLNFIFFIGEFVIEPKKFKSANFLQLIPTFVLSVAVDVNMMLFSGIQPSSYLLQIVTLITGCAFFGLSLAFMISANVILMPGDAFIKLICGKYHKEYGNIKTIMDVSVVLLAVIVSLIFLNTIYGVREGTLIAALTIGSFSRLFGKFTNTLLREPA